MTLDNKGHRYIDLGKQIQALEDERKTIQKELAKEMPIGSRVVYKGETYCWMTYDRSAKSWKDLFGEAFRHLDDEGQVIVGEAERRSTKVTAHFKFEKR